MARTNHSDAIENKAPIKEDTPAPGRPGYFSTGPSRAWLYGLLAVLLIILVFLAGIGAASRHHFGQVYKTGNIVRGPGMMGYGRHGFGGGEAGSTSTATGQTRTSGVVIAVNGSGFTIAGHGSTTGVTTNSSTQYVGGNQVKQNDSVIVVGTDNNGAVTASRIMINP